MSVYDDDSLLTATPVSGCPVGAVVSQGDINATIDLPHGKALIAGAMMMANLFFGDELVKARPVHQHQDGPTNRVERSGQIGKLLPADGGSVKILSPTKDQIRRDHISLEFKLVKGKRGHPVHAYVNGQLMGMFNSQTGTTHRVRPGNYILELRDVAEGHKSELNAIDQVSFIIK